MVFDKRSVKLLKHQFRVNRLNNNIPDVEDVSFNMRLSRLTRSWDPINFFTMFPIRHPELPAPSTTLRALSKLPAVSKCLLQIGYQVIGIVQSYIKTDHFMRAVARIELFRRHRGGVLLCSVLKHRGNQLTLRRCPSTSRAANRRRRHRASIRCSRM